MSSREYVNELGSHTLTLFRLIEKFRELWGLHMTITISSWTDVGIIYHLTFAILRRHVHIRISYSRRIPSKREQSNQPLQTYCILYLKSSCQMPCRRISCHDQIAWTRVMWVFTRVEVVVGHWTHSFFCWPDCQFFGPIEIISTRCSL